MIKSKKVIIIILSVVLLVIVGAFVFIGKPTNTREDATIKAQEYVLKRYDNKFSECTVLDVSLEENTWVVSFGEEESIYMAGGGYPMVFINKNNDKLIWSLLQK